MKVLYLSIILITLFRASSAGCYNPENYLNKTLNITAVGISGNILKYESEGDKLLVTIESDKIFWFNEPIIPNFCKDRCIIKYTLSKCDTLLCKLNEIIREHDYDNDGCILSSPNDMDEFIYGPKCGKVFIFMRANEAKTEYIPIANPLKNFYGERRSDMWNRRTVLYERNVEPKKKEEKEVTKIINSPVNYEEISPILHGCTISCNIPEYSQVGTFNYVGVSQHYFFAVREDFEYLNIKMNVVGCKCPYNNCDRRLYNDKRHMIFMGSQLGMIPLDITYSKTYEGFHAFTISMYDRSVELVDTGIKCGIIEGYTFTFVGLTICSGKYNIPDETISPILDYETKVVTIY